VDSVEEAWRVFVGTVAAEEADSAVGEEGCGVPEVGEYDIGFLGKGSGFRREGEEAKDTGRE
jgi:hypothetical protein